MKNLIIFVILSFVFCLQIFAQGNLSCPIIFIASHDELIRAGANAAFTAKVSGIETEKLTYKWTVSAGTIIEGQGTLSIKVDTTGLDGQSITAVIEVKGFPEGYRNNEAGTAKVEALVMDGGPFGKIDEYGKASFKEETYRLEQIAIALNENKEIGVAIIFYFPKKNHQQSFKMRKTFISKYLIERHKISIDRVEFFDGGLGESKTEVWARPLENVKRMKNY